MLTTYLTDLEQADLAIASHSRLLSKLSSTLGLPDRATPCPFRVPPDRDAHRLVAVVADLEAWK
jgi:hypothetical protein